MSEDSPVLKTSQGYDLWAGAYDDFSNPLVTMAHRAMQLRPEDVRGKRVLELGCGTARHAEGFLAGGAVSYTGVDGSAGMLAEGRRKFADERVTLVEGDIQGVLAIDGGAVDLVFISLVLEHLPTLGRVFENVARVLEPGGGVRILELHAERQRGGTRAHFVHEGKDVALASYPHEEGEIRAALEKVGLRMQQVEEMGADEVTLGQCPKLAKYGGGKVLIDVRGMK